MASPVQKLFAEEMLIVWIAMLYLQSNMRVTKCTSMKIWVNVFGINTIFSDYYLLVHICNWIKLSWSIVCTCICYFKGLFLFVVFLRTRFDQIYHWICLNCIFNVLRVLQHVSICGKCNCHPRTLHTTCCTLHTASAFCSFFTHSIVFLKIHIKNVVSKCVAKKHNHWCS